MNGRTACEHQDEEDRTNYWGMWESMGGGRETEAERASDDLKWFEGRSIEPIDKEKRKDEPPKFIYDENLPF